MESTQPLLHYSLVLAWLLEEVYSQKELPREKVLE